MEKNMYVAKEKIEGICVAMAEVRGRQTIRCPFNRRIKSKKVKEEVKLKVKEVEIQKVDIEVEINLKAKEVQVGELS